MLNIIFKAIEESFSTPSTQFDSPMSYVQDKANSSFLDTFDVIVTKIDQELCERDTFSITIPHTPYSELFQTMMSVVLKR